MTKDTSKRLTELRAVRNKIEARGLYPSQALHQEIAQLEARIQITTQPAPGVEAQGHPAPAPEKEE